MTGNKRPYARPISPWISRCINALFIIPIGMLSAAQAQTLVWSEEFNYTSAPDSAVWSYDTGNWGWGNQELQDYTSNANNVWVDGSNLVITARRSGNYFSSARIKTIDKLTFKYGTIEARISTPDLSDGLWPAFWSMGNDFSSVGWPDCGEIDVMEMGINGAIGAGLVNQRVGSHLHWDNNGSYAGAGDYHDMTSPIDGTFVVYRMEWTPTQVRTYINGINIWTMNTGSIPEFNAPHFFILNLAVGGNYPGITNPSQITAPFPAEYRCDWIRIYDNGHTVLGGSSQPAGPSTPYSGTPMAIPGIIEAEYFDNGGQNAAYYDATPSNEGGDFRTSEGVDIETCSDTGAGYNIGYTESGEWMKYTVDIASAGNYTIISRVARGISGTGAFHIEVDGVDVTGSIPVSSTGGWQNWVDKTSSVTLSSGEQAVRIVIESGDININRIEFVLDQAVNTPPAFTSSSFIKANATEDAAYTGQTMDGDATDADSDPLSFSLVPGGPAWLNVATNGALSGTPENADVGLNSWTVQVSDGNGGTDTAILYITVNNVNDDPVFTEDPIIRPNVGEGNGYSSTLAGSATDVDAGAPPLTYSKVLGTGPTWLNVHSSGLLYGVPGNADVGPNSWTVQVSDGNGGIDTAELQITVDGLEAPPTLSIQISGSNLEILWPSSATAYSLYGCTNLLPPVVWSTVTNTPVIQGDDWMVTIPIVGAPNFFGLQAP